VFCPGDLYGVQLLDACRRMDVAVPEQIAVVGLANDPVVCSVCTPPLSSIDLDPIGIGYEAGALLARIMSGVPPPDGPIWRQPSHVAQRQSSAVLAISNPDVAEAVRFIRDHACRGLTVAALANAVALSRSTPERRFQQCLQRTPKQELLRVQMDRARMLPRETDLRIDAVSKSSGFASLKYFSRVFRREAGITPRVYRKQTLAGSHS
jgi:LacI family transcriptional regulator